MSADSNAESTRRSTWPIWFAAIAFALPLVYLMSVAPVWRLAQPPKHSGPYRFYGPVFSLMRHTPLRTPLLAWCSVWGVQEKIERHLERLEMERSIDMPAPTMGL